MTTETNLDLSGWYPLDAFVERHDGRFSKSQIRWLLRERERNGLSQAVALFGRKLYIHEDAFAEWFATYCREQAMRAA